jgi:hypothetical protein
MLCLIPTNVSVDKDLSCIFRGQMSLQLVDQVACHGEDMFSWYKSSWNSYTGTFVQVLQG